MKPIGTLKAFDSIKIWFESSKMDLRNVAFHWSGSWGYCTGV